MQQKLKIFLAYSEVAPFTKTGGVGDVGGALPKYLKEQGHDVRVITPQYRGINERRYILRDVIRLQDIEIPLGENVVTANVKSAFLPNSKVQVYFLDYKPFFFRTGIYGHPESGLPYEDNAQRYILFSKSVLETLKKLQWQPDVIHCNNWQTALIPFLLRTQYKNDDFFKSVSSLLSVHNFQSQGVFPNSSISFMNLDKDSEALVQSKNGKINFLGTGLFYANYYNAVNNAYYEEIVNNEKKVNGINDIIQSRLNAFINIENGVDETVWDPETDPLIVSPYSIESPNDKKLNKQSILENAGLLFDDKLPLFAITLPLLDDKEQDTLPAIFEEIMQYDAIYAVICDSRYHMNKKLKLIQKTHKKKMIILDTNEKSFHQCLAGADAFLSLFQKEESLLLSMYALKYGALPVVSNMSGIESVIEPINQKMGTGNGFLFEGHAVKSIGKAVKNVVKNYISSNWQLLMKNAMKKDFSWIGPAENYWQVYGKCVSEQKKS